MDEGCGGGDSPNPLLTWKSMVVLPCYNYLKFLFIRNTIKQLCQNSYEFSRCAACRQLARQAVWLVLYDWGQTQQVPCDWSQRPYLHFKKNNNIVIYIYIKKSKNITFTLHYKHLLIFTSPVLWLHTLWYFPFPLSLAFLLALALLLVLYTVPLDAGVLVIVILFYSFKQSRKALFVFVRVIFFVVFNSLVSLLYVLV